MKGKLILHYFITFIAACSIIFLVNISFMRINIYNQSALYNYNPDEIIESFKEYIFLSKDNKIMVDDKGLSFLQENNMGLQVLNEENEEVFSYRKPTSASKQYSNLSLINMYTSEDVTMFLNEKIIEEKNYTYLLFLDANKVNRTTFSYDVELVKRAHKFPILIIINIGLILIMSFLFTLRITKPINRIINKIISLYKGVYLKNNIKQGIYYNVEIKLNELSDRLNSNEIERNKLEEMREEWISNITHDIKTPLTSIMGSAEILSDTEYDIDNKIREKYCNIIMKKSEYIKTLVEDLNLSTRLKNNSLVLNKKKINIVSLIRHVIIDIINDEKYNHKNIEFIYSEEEIFLEVDEQLIKRVFVNLIINSFIHNSESVKVKIVISKLKNNNISISIRDNGKGVSTEELNNIFKRYYRGTNTRNKVEGSGLGMAIAHDIIKAHEGNIKAENIVNEGLEISIILKKL